MTKNRTLKGYSAGELTLQRYGWGYLPSCAASLDTGPSASQIAFGPAKHYLMITQKSQLC